MSSAYPIFCLLFIGSILNSCTSKKSDPVIQANIQHEYEDSLQTELNARMAQQHQQNTQRLGYVHPSLPDNHGLMALQRYFNRFELPGTGYELNHDGQVSYYQYDTLRYSFNLANVELDTVRMQVLLPNGKPLYFRCLPMFFSKSNNADITMADGTSKRSQLFGINNDCPCHDSWTVKDKYHRAFTLQVINRFLSYRKAYNDYRRLIGATD